jgi:hypothetical protein
MPAGFSRGRGAVVNLMRQPRNLVVQLLRLSDKVRHGLVVRDTLVLEGRSIEKRDHLTGQCIALRGDRADRGQLLPMGDVVADDGCVGKELPARLFILHAHRKR